MRIAVVVKQVPTFTEMALDDHGRLIRAGLPLELNPYCRRAVSQAVDLAAAAAVSPGRSQQDHPTVTIVTLGPPTAEDALREAIAWGLDRGVDTDGLLITDPAFAGSDTLATANALATTLRQAGPFDLILAGRNSVDADTGQVPPQMAELLDIPFLTGVRTLQLDGSTAHARCEHDDGWVDAEVDLPALLSCAERLIEPAKVDATGRAAVPAERITTISAADLGPGPWGQDGSPTCVGAVRVHEVFREGILLYGPLEDQVRAAVDVLVRRAALAARPEGGGGPLGESVPRPGNRSGPAVGVVLEVDRLHVAQELLSAAAELAEAIDGHVVALADPADSDPARLGAWGADEVVLLHLASDRRPSTADPPTGTDVSLSSGLTAEDVAAAAATWAIEVGPWAVLAPSTAWGREVAGRAAARLGAGLTGDAVGFDV
ncbi:MAG: electron transfer flavoprotein subunit beta/FixA family protein, partial [Actinobacteria bacterium]|nr:electron transfer flavoprotein subunit beta/FixA family protein [Actinomycetota bacterium]